MRNYLRYYGLWDVVSKPVPGTSKAKSVIDLDSDDPFGDNDTVASEAEISFKPNQSLVKKAERASLEILAAISSEEVSALVYDVPDGNAYALWHRLESFYEKRNQASHSQLMTEFFNIKQRPHEAVELYIARIRKLIVGLQQCTGERMDRKTVLFRFLAGLNPMFDHARSALEASRDYSKFTFDEASAYIVGQASLLQLRRNAQQQSSSDSLSKSNQRTSGAHAASVKIKCNFCHRTGHTEDQCRDKKKQQDGSKPAAVTCGWCEKPGHSEQKCYRKRDGKPKGKIPLNPSTKESSAPAQSLLVAGANCVAVIPDGSVATAALAFAPAPVALLDTGCARHTVGPSTQLTNEAPCPEVRIQVATGEILSSPTRGSLLLSPAQGDAPAIQLHDVLKHPNIHHNLLSVSTICQSNDVDRAVFTRDEAEIIGRNGQVLLRARVKDGLYVVDLTHGTFNAGVNVAATKRVDPTIWHARLSHMSATSINKLIRADVVDGLADALSPGDYLSTHVCSGCTKGKSHRQPFATKPSSHRATKRILDRIVFDYTGPFHCPSLGGSVHALVVMDEYSRKVWCFFHANRSQGPQELLTLFKRVQVEQGLKIIEIHSDGAAEFNDGTIVDWCKENGTRQTFTVPHTSQHNPICERAIRTIVEYGRSNLHHANAPLCLWAEAVGYAALVLNMASIREGCTQTPDLIWNPKLKPSVRKLRVWGCDAHVHIPDADRRKLDAKSVVCIFLGFDTGDAYYKFFDVAAYRIIRSRDAVFDERSFTQCKALHQLQLQSHDSSASPETNEEFMDFIDDVRFQAEIRIAEIASREISDSVQVSSGNAPATATGATNESPSVHMPSAPSGVAAAPETSLSFPDELEDEISDPTWLPPPESDTTSPPPAVTPNPIDRPRRSERARQQPSNPGFIRWEDVGAHLAHAAANSGAEPLTISEAINGPEKDGWTDAVNLEINSLIKNNTWEITKLPPGRKAIGTRMIFKRKLDSNGVVARLKARLVAKGFAQREGVDYNETFAPVLSYTSLRVMFAIVAALDLDFIHLDVETAFLNAKVKEEIYITLPTGFHAAGFKAGDSTSTTVLRLLKSLYGIKQAPRDWHEEIDGSIQQLGYRRCSSEQCIYIKLSKNGYPIFICLFVDDMPCAMHSNDRQEFEADKQALGKKYKIQDLGDAKLVLGMRITRDRRARTLKVDQENYVQRLLEKCQMQDCIPADTPAEPGSHLSMLPTHHSNNDDPGMTALQYGSVVGSLLYAAISTRPDISYAVGVLSRFISNPQPHHWHAAKRVLRYLKGTSQLGLTYRAIPSTDGGRSHFSPQILLGPAFTDANWGGDLDDRKSTSGMVTKINGCAISWRSKKQNVVAQSSAEAEYIATSDAVKETLWQRQLLTELTFPPTSGTVLRGDNETAIALAKNNILHNRTKHIDIRHHFLRDHIRSKEIDLQWVSTNEQEADIFTKALGKQPFARFRDRIMGSNLADSHSSYQA